MAFVRRAAAIVLFGVLAACGGDDADNGANANGSDGAIELSTKLAPFEGFSKSMGPLPSATSPARLTLGVTAKGDLTVEGAGRIEGGKLVGKAGSGKLSLAAGFALEGHLKVDTGLPAAPKYDGDLPGLKDISIPLDGATVFDPFIVDDEKSEVVVKVPETALPEIPLGTVPGKLLLTISNKSEVHAAFRGTCVSVKSGAASWKGEIVRSGTLVLKGAIELEVPVYQKTIDLPEVSIPIELPPEAVELTSGSVDADDSSEGSCGATNAGTAAAPSTDPAANGGSTTTQPFPTPTPSTDGGTGTSDGGDAGDASTTCPQVAACPGTNIGTIRGDIGDDFIQITGVGHEYFTVHVDEGSTGSTQLSLEAELVTPGGLYLGAKSLTISAMELNTCYGGSVLISYADKAGVTWPDLTGTEDGRNFVIHIAPNGPNACVPWTLNVHR